MLREPSRLNIIALGCWNGGWCLASSLLGIRPSHVQLESGLETDVWMNGWVLKKLSKDVFDGIADDVKDIK